MSASLVATENTSFPQKQKVLERFGRLAVEGPPSGALSPRRAARSPWATLAYLGDTKGGTTGQPTTMVSTLVRSDPSSITVPVVGPTNPALPPPSPEDIELTPQGIQSLPSLPVTGVVEVSGIVRSTPGRPTSWPSDSTTRSLKVTVSHDPSLPVPANPAPISFTSSARRATSWPSSRVPRRWGRPASGCHDLPQRYSPGCSAPGASRRDPDRRSPGTDARAAVRPRLRSSLYHAGATYRAHSSSGFSPLGLAVGAVGPLLITYLSSALSLVPTTLATVRLLQQRCRLTGPCAGEEHRSPVDFSPGHGGIRDGGTGRLGRSPREPRLGAIGPILATTPGGSTQTIERSERAFSDLASTTSGIVTGVDVQLFDVLAASLEGLSGRGPRTRERPGGRAASLIALRGPGGFPLIVSTLTGERPQVDPSCAPGHLASGRNGRRGGVRDRTLRPCSDQDP